jgi:hypothetical protein
VLRTSLANELRCNCKVPIHIPDNATFLVHDGDLHVDSAISLDWTHGWINGEIIDLIADPKDLVKGGLIGSPPPTGLCGLVVTGSFHISGALVNESSDSGATLIVQGNSTARQASCGGAYIHVVGDAHIADVLYAHYNDGELHIGGALFAKALIKDDHFVSISGNSKLHPQNKLQIFDLREILNGEDSEHVPKALKSVVGNSALTLAQILDALSKCQPTSTLGKPQTAQDWKSAIWKDLNAIRKLPKRFRTEETYLSLLTLDCTLSEPEIHELVSQIPLKMLSDKVRMSAFLLSPKSLLRLPPEFDLKLEYARCLGALSSPDDYIAEVPSQFLPGSP